MEIGKNATDEYMEIYNPTDKDIDLEELPLKLHIINSSGSDTNKILNFTTEEKSIRSKGYFFIASKTYAGSEVPLAVYAASGNTLVKNGAVYISTSATDDKDVLDYVYCTEGYPHKIIEEPEPVEYPAGIFLNEILPNPKTGGNEFIEFYNNEKTEVNLKGWHLQDSSTGKIEFKDDFPIAAGDYKYIEKTKDYTSLTLNDDKDSLTLFDPNGKTVSAVDYSGAKDGISYNFDGASWRWSRFLTPGAENIFNNLPSAKTKNPKKGYVNTYVEFSAKGSDADGDKLKYTWDFGDGHKSYQEETRHKYEKAKKYTVTLKISDGSEDKIKTFKIEIKKYPKLNINIVAVVPNPAGKDTAGEYLTLENKSKKKINLKDWAIATGAKKLYNHPIAESLIIPPGGKIKITRDFSKFSLNNKKAEVELRYPGGRLASHVSYDKGTASAQDDEVYQKTGTAWAWVAPGKNIPAADTPAINNRLAKPEEENPTLLGKFSDGPLIAKKQNKIVLAGYAVNFKNAGKFYPSAGKVAGAYAAAGDNFIFTALAVPTKTSQNFWAKIFTAFNGFINSIVRQN